MPQSNAASRRSVDVGLRARGSAFLQSAAAPLIVALLLLIGLGWYCRVHDFDYYQSFLFDEHHFVENARRYLRHETDQNDHPPLGKLAIALAMAQLGDRPLAWRLPALLYGLATVLLGAWTAKRFFKSSLAGLLAAAFLSADGFLIGYSRAALLDGALALSAVAALALTTCRAGFGWALLGGLLAGSAMAVKFSGVGTLVPLFVVLALRRTQRAPTLAALVLVSAAATYLAWFTLGLGLSGRDASVALAISETGRLYAHHAALTDMKNPWTSSWATWVIPWRPLVLGLAHQAGTVRTLSSLPNLALWWGTWLCSTGLLALIVAHGIRPLLASSALSKGVQALKAALESTGLWDFSLDAGEPLALILSCSAAFLAPWVLTHRDSYFYHSLPIYAPLLLLTAGYGTWLWTRRPTWLLTFVALVMVVSAAYAPLWSFAHISERTFQQRLFLQSWR